MRLRTHRARYAAEDTIKMTVDFLYSQRSERFQSALQCGEIDDLWVEEEGEAVFREEQRRAEDEMDSRPTRSGSVESSSGREMRSVWPRSSLLLRRTGPSMFLRTACVQFVGIILYDRGRVDEKALAFALFSTEESRRALPPLASTLLHGLVEGGQQLICASPIHTFAANTPLRAGDFLKLSAVLDTPSTIPPSYRGNVCRFNYYLVIRYVWTDSKDRVREHTVKHLLAMRHPMCSVVPLHSPFTAAMMHRFDYRMHSMFIPLVPSPAIAPPLSHSLLSRDEVWADQGDPMATYSSTLISSGSSRTDHTVCSFQQENSVPVEYTIRFQHEPIVRLLLTGTVINLRDSVQGMLTFEQHPRFELCDPRRSANEDSSSADDMDMCDEEEYRHDPTDPDSSSSIAQTSKWLCARVEAEVVVAERIPKKLFRSGVVIPRADPPKVKGTTVYMRDAYFTGQDTAEFDVYSANDPKKGAPDGTSAYILTRNDVVIQKSWSTSLCMKVPFSLHLSPINVAQTMRTDIVRREYSLRFKFHFAKRCDVERLLWPPREGEYGSGGAGPPLDPRYQEIVIPLTVIDIADYVNFETGVHAADLHIGEPVFVLKAEE